MSTGLLIARLILGLGLAARGAQKLFGWFGGRGLEQTATVFEAMGFRPGLPYVVAAGLAEVGGGLLTALGLFGPIGPAVLISVMLVAMITVHWGHGFFAASNGIEFPLVYATGALALAFAGPGAYSLDAVFGLEWLWDPTLAWITIAIAVVVALGTNLLRRRATPQARATA